MTKLTQKKLGHICDEGGGEIKTGPFGTQLHKSDYRREGIPVVMPKNILSGKISTEGIARIDDADATRLSQHRHTVGDIVYGRRGDIGRHALITRREDGWLCGTGCLRIRLGNGELNPKYLHYYLDQEHVIQWICNQSVGATMPNLNTAILRSVPIKYPTFDVQRKIVSILSAYDDLIENSLRRIKILEEMAQNVYREWFIKFRFPGHEKVRMVDSELGMVPEGWEISSVEETFEILGGGTPSKKIAEYWENGHINWYSPTNLTASKSMFMDESRIKITEAGLKRSSARLFPSYSVMMTSRATLGVLSINTTEACTNQGFITCIPNDKMPLYTLFFWLKENVEKFISLGTGATFKEITKGVFKTIDVLVPPTNIGKVYEDFADPIGKQVLNVYRRAAVLRQTRDLLLPRLISGELDISEQNITIPEEAA